MMKRLTVNIALGLALLTSFVVGCHRCSGDRAKTETSAATEERREGRLVVLGFDGVDPRWLERWAGEGKLPNLARLMKASNGTYRHLASTNPPQSPVAWTTFATGTLPGDHGIFDFIGRTLSQRAGAPPVSPTVATTSFEAQQVGPPVARNLRTGEPFWQALSGEGIRVVALNVPYSFPPDPMRDGRMLSGLGVPDLRETNSTFTYVGTDVTAEQSANPPGGGVMVRLQVNDGRGRFELEGPSIPGAQGRRMVIPIDVRTEAPGGAVTIGVQGRDVRLEPRVPSAWIDLKFAHDGREVRGIARFLSLGTGSDTRIFVTPVSFDPRAPYSPITYPNAFAAHLVDAIGGLYKTVGWDHDTSSLNAEVVDEDAFLADMNSIETDRRAMLRVALADRNWDMLVWVSTATDRVAHMFYRLIDPQHPRYDAALAARHGDAIEHEYRRMDETVGMVLRALGPKDTLLILSDHGFHNYRRGLHVNQWLRREGLLTLREGANGSPREFFLDVDWSQTRAYALGTGQIYLNMRGRERDGIVSDSEAPALLTRIRTALLALRDADRDNAQVIRNVYVAKDVFRGGRSQDAPDLQIAFAENYRTSWETILGGVPAELFADNPRKWSGDHAASDVAETPGILVSNRSLRDNVGIVDLAPTAFSFFGKRAPHHYVGASVLVPSE